MQDVVSQEGIPLTLKVDAKIASEKATIEAKAAAAALDAAAAAQAAAKAKA